MSHRIEEKELRRQERLAAAEDAQRRERNRNRAFWAIGATLVVGLLVAAFALPARNTTTPAAPASSNTAAGAPVAPGDTAPDFRARDVVGDRDVTLADLRDRKTLLFFSEGANCQACMVQAAELEKSKAFGKTGIGLVSVTNDPPDVLEQVAAQYGITTPLLADDSRAMTSAYGQLGRGGMGHPETGGHSFVLLDQKGNVAWEQAYQEMYVPTPRLLDDMGV